MGSRSDWSTPKNCGSQSEGNVIGVDQSGRLPIGIDQSGGNIIGVDQSEDSKLENY